MANDVGIISGIVGFFLILGFILPFIQSDFNQAVSDPQYEEVQTNFDEGVSDAQSLTGVSVLAGGVPSLFKILFSMISIFFWSFAGIPVWLNVLLLIPRFMLAFIIARNVWVGGGG